MNNLRLRQTLAWLIPLLLFAVALAVRLYRLDQIPPGLWSDEAANGLDVMDLQQGHYRIFFPRNNGREPLFIYWQALAVTLLGVSPYALRVAAALAGAATVPTTYWLVRTLWRGHELPADWAAFWTALLLTFGYWHLTMSRLGFRAITLPLVASLAAIFFWRAWPQVSGAARLPWRDLILCGVLVGLTLYTYTAGRFIPLLIGLTVVGALLTARTAQERWRSLLALGIIGLSALLVFAPLGLYFWRHPEYFLAHASDVSILNQTYGGSNPLLAFADSAWQTVQMFATRPDGNLRHNPAGRPIFDPLLAGWLLVGVGYALWRWRALPNLFLLLWCGLLALPAMLTSQGVPHALRSLGMVPAIYILPVVGLLWVGQWGARWWRGLAYWLPIPFVLLSSLLSVQAYFGAWSDVGRFRQAFLIDYAQSAQRIVQQNETATAWVLPLSPNYVRAEGSWPYYYTFEFFLHNHITNGMVIADEAQAPATLTQLAQGHSSIALLRLDEDEFSSGIYGVNADVKHLVAFLLQKHGQLLHKSAGADLGLPYERYALPANPRFSVTEQPAPQQISFAGQVQLVELDYGRTALELSEPSAERNVKRLPAGQRLWAVLRWQALHDLDFDLKASLLLKDEQGHLAGQVDDLLVGDRYPALRRWSAGEVASIYQILPILPGIAPGRYQLYLKVYEDDSGRIYPATGAAGQQLGTEASLGAVEITPASAATPLTPTVTLPGEQTLAPDLRLLGFDLARNAVAPGDTLAVTLYWQALAKLAQDYHFRVQLRSADGTTLVQQTQRPGQGRYATLQWRADEQLRDWHDLTVPPTTPAGQYELWVSVMAGQQNLGEVALAAVEVSGRPRQFTVPPLAQPITATFGTELQLLGLAAPGPLTVAPGATLPLTLTWQVRATAAAPLIRFVHLLNAAGQVVAQQDAPPCNGECPATSWLANEILLDPALLALPTDLAAGNYRLAVGWYDEATQQRLAGSADTGQPLADQVLFLPLTVVVQ